MKVVVGVYFQEPDGVWHQPGDLWECSPEHHRIKLGQLKPYQGAVIETAMMEQPEPLAVHVIKRRGRRRK